MLMARTVIRLPADYYYRAGYDPEVRNWWATTQDAFDAQAALPAPLNPPGGYRTQPVIGAVAAVCRFGENRKLTELRLFPVSLVKGHRSRSGLPLLADGETASKIVAFLAELSSPFGTNIEFKDGIGVVRL